MGVLTDIDSDGFLSPAFHAFPDRLRWDPLSGDNGPNFFGHAWNTATYVINHREFGWLAFGGNLSEAGDIVRVTPLDSSRTRLYLAPVGLWLTLDAGKITTAELNIKNGAVRLGLAAADQFTSAAVLRIEIPARGKDARYHPLAAFKVERGGVVVPLGADTTWVQLVTNAKE